MVDLNQVLQNQLSLMGKVAPFLNAAGDAFGDSTSGNVLNNLSKQFVTYSTAPIIHARVRSGGIDISTTPFKTTTTSTTSNVSANNSSVGGGLLSGLGGLFQSPLVILGLIAVLALRR